MLKICQDCGCEYEAGGEKSRFCPICIKRRQSEAAKDRNLCKIGGRINADKQKEKRQSRKKPEKVSVCDSYCTGCTFLGYGNGTTKLCEYFLKTSFRRPCPAGTGCTVKHTGKRRNVWSYQNDATWKNKQSGQLTCPVCGAEFWPSDHRQKYCSANCKSKAANRAYRARKKVAANG